MTLQEQLDLLEKEHDFIDGYECVNCGIKKDYFTAWKRGLLKLEKEGETPSENHFLVIKCSARQKLVRL